MLAIDVTSKCLKRHLSVMFNVCTHTYSLCGKTDLRKKVQIWNTNCGNNFSE